MKYDADEHVKEVYSHFGLAIYLAQVLEHAIVNALVYCDLFPNRKPSHTRVDFDLFMDKNFAKTMGQIINNFRQFVSIPPDLESLLIEALNKRNWLVHRYFRERAKEFIKEEGREKMLVELLEAQALFKKADHVLGEVTRPLRERFGFTDEKLAKHLYHYLEKIG